MRWRVLLLLAAMATAYGQVVKSLPTSPDVIARSIKGKPIALGTFIGLERRFDGKFFEIGNADNPIDLLGNTRGVHVDGFGTVFTTELGLLLTPGLNPFMQTIPKERIVKVHQQKLDRLPALRKAMRELIQVAALTLVQLADSDQIVVAVRLDYSKWEDTSGLPGQIIMRADRKSALSGQITTTEEQ
jgi:hypothetical protein